MNPAVQPPLLPERPHLCYELKHSLVRVGLSGLAEKDTVIEVIAGENLTLYL